MTKGCVLSGAVISFLENGATKCGDPVILDLIATIRDRDKTIAELREQLARYLRWRERIGKWDEELAREEQKNALMLEALELAETAILNGDDPELVLSHIQECLSQVKGAQS